MNKRCERSNVTRIPEMPSFKTSNIGITPRDRILKNNYCLKARNLHFKLSSTMEFFLNGAELSLNPVNSGNLINHWSMNWPQFKDPVSHMCLAGTVVASWSLAQQEAGSSPFIVMTNIFANSVKTYRKNSNTPIRMCYLWGKRWNF